MDDNDEQKPARTPKEMLRDGDSLRAKFFRWKDKVMEGVQLDKMPAAGAAPFSLSDPTVSARALETKDRLVASPDDRGAYDDAVKAFREMATSLKAAGLPVNVDAAEE